MLSKAAGDSVQRTDSQNIAIQPTNLSPATSPVTTEYLPSHPTAVKPAVENPVMAALQRPFKGIFKTLSYLPLRSHRSAPVSAPAPFRILHDDPVAADLLISSICEAANYAVAPGYHWDLVEDCILPRELRFIKTAPFPPARVLELLNDTPSIQVLRKSVERNFSRIDPDLVTLLSWIFTQHGECLRLASPRLRLGDVHSPYQFIVPARPHPQEAIFRENVGSNSTTALFHGTPLRCLYPILRNGLQSTRTGKNKSSKIVFFAPEPPKALYYSIDTPPSNPWPSSKIKEPYILLGCEGKVESSTAAGDGEFLDDDEVVLDHQCSIVRYVLVFDGKAAAAAVAKDLGQEMVQKFQAWPSRGTNGDGV
jgi:hypothetical protein